MQDYCKTTQDTNVMQIMTQITMKVWESLQEGQAVVNERGESESVGIFARGTSGGK